MKNYLFGLLLFFSFAANAQVESPIKKKASYTVNITATPQLFLNACNVKNDGIYPETISARNTGGYTLGLEIERKSRHGLILNAALQYGKQYHNVTMGYQDISFFDPSNADELKGLGPIITNFKASTAYVNFRMMIGYVLPFEILNGCKLETKVGGSSRIYIRGFQGGDDIIMNFVKNDTLFLGAWVSRQSIRLGNDYPPYSYSQTFEGYIGLCKNLNHKWLKNVSFGLEFTRSITAGQQSGNASAYVFSYTMYKKEPISSDRYDGKDLSIRMAVGLWHK